MLKSSCILACAFALSFVDVNAQAPAVKAAGNVTSTRVNGQTFTFATENASAQLTIFSPTVIRVRVNRAAPTRDFSYAVTATPQPTVLKTNASAEEFSIETDSMRISVGKKPFSVTFYTKDGRVINRDEPGLTTSWVGDEVTTYKTMQDGERFIGLGEKTGNLDRRGNGYTNWNSDVFGYSTGQDPLYSSIPFYVGIHHRLNYGIFLDNTYQTEFNFGASNNRFSSFGAQNGEMNYYFIYQTKLADIVSSYTWLTGRMTLPPLWSLGYQQNRYSYYPETEVMRIAQTLREKKIPADGITLDIHYMDAYKLFTWNKERFPDPVKMTGKLNEMGFKVTTIVDPGIKTEKGYGAYERGVEAGIFVKYPDGTNYTGQVWPGWCHFPDFTSAKGRDWWKNEVKFFSNTGVSGIWNDMNEIATWGQKIPSNVLFDFDGQQTTHKQAHNVYGMQMARSSYEGMKANTGKRPFVLTRAGYAGLQRYTAIWTGDNRSEEDHMLLGVRLLNSLGVSGVAFTGMDIGGFTGNPATGLFARWMQIGAFTPYFRNHTAVNTASSEPWAHGEEVLEISRNYVNLRYRLLPYLYSGFYEASQNGQPLMRTLALDHPFDDKVYDGQFQNEYFFGKAFLVAPVESNKNYLNVYFPKGSFYSLYNDAREQGETEKVIPVGIQKLPVYVKESSIIPMQSLVQTTAEKPTDTLVVHLYKGTLKNTYTYYEDDGESYSYEKGDYYKRAFTYDPAANTFSAAQPEGDRRSKFTYIRFVLHGFTGSSVRIGGTSTNLRDERFSFLSPISSFDPLGGNGRAEGCEVKTVVTRNEASAITLSLP